MGHALMPRPDVTPWCHARMSRPVVTHWRHALMCHATPCHVPIRPWDYHHYRGVTRIYVLLKEKILEASRTSIWPRTTHVSWSRVSVWITCEKHMEQWSPRVLITCICPNHVQEAHGTRKSTCSEPYLETVVLEHSQGNSWSTCSVGETGMRGQMTDRCVGVDAYKRWLFWGVSQKRWGMQSSSIYSCGLETLEDHDY